MTAQYMKEVTQHGAVTSTEFHEASDGFVVDAIVLTFADGWSLWLYQVEDQPVGATRADWFDADGQPQEVQ